MSGKRYLLDTNAVVSLLAGNTELGNRLREASWVGISNITQLEFLAFPELAEDDRKLFLDFLEQVTVIGLSPTDPELVNEALSVRRAHKLKLPDAIIAVSALNQRAILITADTEFSRITRLHLRVP